MDHSSIAQTVYQPDNSGDRETNELIWREWHVQCGMCWLPPLQVIHIIGHTGCASQKFCKGKINTCTNLINHSYPI